MQRCLIINEKILLYHDSEERKIIKIIVFTDIKGSI